MYPSASFSTRTDNGGGLRYNTFNAREPVFTSGPKPIAGSSINPSVPPTAGGAGAHGRCLISI